MYLLEDGFPAKSETLASIKFKKINIKFFKLKNIFKDEIKNYFNLLYLTNYELNFYFSCVFIFVN